MKNKCDGTYIPRYASKRQYIDDQYSYAIDEQQEVCINCRKEECDYLQKQEDEKYYQKKSS